MRYLLDTNIVSELARERPDRQLEELAAQHARHSAIAAPTLDELEFGIRLLPADSNKRLGLERWLANLKTTLDVLPFDRYAATWHARERSRLRTEGKASALLDGQIAAIAAVNELILVTRNVRDFQYFQGLQLENWFGQ